MTRRFVRFLIFTLSIVFVFAAACSAQAATLNELRQQFVEYQKAPLERARELRGKLDDMRRMEEGIARQFDVPVTRVLVFENRMEELVNFYQVLHYQQKHVATNNFFTGDDMRLRELVEAKPPYNYLFYISFIEELQNHRDELAASKARQARLHDILAENAEDRLVAERSFRLYSDKLAGNPPNRLNLTWELMAAETFLEQVTVRQTSYAAELKICDKRIEALEEKLSVMEPMVGKIRQDLNFERYDFVYLDARIDRKTAELNETLSLLNGQYDYLDSLQGASSRPSDVVKYVLEIDAGFLQEETELVLNMTESWNAMRMVWRAFVDLVEENLDVAGEQQLLTATEMYTDFATENTERSGRLLHRTKELEDQTQRRFAHPETLPPQDQKVLVRFYSDLDARKQRYLGYIMDLGTINSRFADLQEDIKLILQKTDSQKLWSASWQQTFSGLMNRELWYFDDRPISVRKILDALLLFFAGFLVTHYVSFLARRRMAKRASISVHNQLLITKFLYYTGIVISFFVALWSLHIPMTAFAFLGGAMAIALGFGTQRIMGDMFSGIILLFQKKLRIGDAVIIDDELGVVKEITLQNTVIRSKETLDHIIPNSKVLDSHIVNLTLGTTVMRMELDVTIGASDPVETAIRIVDEILKEESSVLAKPPHKILFSEFAADGNTLTAIFFVDMAKTRRREIASKLRHRILERFTAAGISIPAPQSEITIKETHLPEE